MKRSRRILCAALLLCSFVTAAAWAEPDVPDSIIIKKHPFTAVQKGEAKNKNATVTAKTAVAKPAAKDDAKNTAKAEEKGKDRYEPEIIAHPTQADLSTQPLVIAPLQEKDFSIGGILSGDDLNKVRRVFGNATKFSSSEHFTTLRYNTDDLKLRVTLRNDTAEILKEPDEAGNAVRVGVDSMFIAHGSDIVVGRDIHLGYPIELVIRRYGVPTNILRDTDANIYYVVYESPLKKSMLVFAVRERKVERIALMPPRPPYTVSGEITGQGSFVPRDFAMMGFNLEEPFKDNKYNMWLTMIKRKENKFWIYGDYGVEVDRHNTIKRVFLLTNNAYTNRGATLGYHISTILALYGLPQRLERGADGAKSVDGYFYDSPYQKGASLLFVVKHNGQYVDDILLLDSPVTDLQNPQKRYGLE
jgi:hypothetical protein